MALTKSFGWMSGVAFAAMLSTPAVGVRHLAHAQSDSSHGRPVPRPIRVPQFDPKALQLLENAANHLRSATTMRATVQRIYRGHGDTTGSLVTDDIRAMRPVSLYIETREASGSGKPYFGGRPAILVGVGDSAVSIDRDGKGRWWRFPSGGIQTGTALLDAFFNSSVGAYADVGHWSSARLTDPLIRSVTYAGRQMWNGASYDAITWVYEQAYTMPEDTVVYTTQILIDQQGIMRRVLTTNSKGSADLEERLTNLTLNAPMQASDFTWTNLVHGPVLGMSPSISGVGQRYPEFTKTAFLLDGPRLARTADLLSKKKATVVWFWNTSCSACIAEMPHYEQLYRKWKDKGVNVVALDVVKDTAEQRRARENTAFNRITMPILFDADTWAQQFNQQTKRGRGALAVLDSTGTIRYDDQPDYAKIQEVLEQLTGKY